MRITLGKVAVFIIIVAMVAGLRWLDVNGRLNPLDKVPSVQINQK